jgi:hypothetical protein
VSGGPDPAAFFEAWFSDCTGLVYLAAIRPDGDLMAQGRFPVGHWSRLLAWARKHSDAGHNAYFCPMTQYPGATGPRCESTAYEVPGLFADVDLMSGSADEAARAWSILHETALVTAAVSSGQGFHAYCKLSEPLRVCDGNQVEVKALLYAYGARLNTAVHGHIGRVDRRDLASFLRVPGTTNYPNQKKRTAGRIAVETAVHFQLEGRLQLDQVTAELRQYTRRTRTEESASTGGAKVGDLPPDWDTWLADDATLRGYFERTLRGPHQNDQSPSGYLMSLFNRLWNRYRQRITDAEAGAVGLAFYARVGESKDRRSIGATWAKAKAARGDDGDGAGQREGGDHYERRGAGSGGGSTEPNDPIIESLADVEPESVHWVNHGRIPLGKVTVLDGDPSLGKSTLLFDYAARVSTGGPMPDGSPTDLDGPAGVVIMSAEDGLADTIRPRLEAAGADCRRIVALTGIGMGSAAHRLPTLRDVAAIAEAIGRVAAKLVTIDPLVAYLPSKVNAHHDAHMRGVLVALADLAARTEAAVVVVRHLNKRNDTGNPLYRGGGSIGIIGAARSGLLVARDPDDPTGTRRVLASTKCNLTVAPPALAFHLESVPTGVARVVWTARSTSPPTSCSHRPNLTRRRNWTWRRTSSAAS